MAVELRSYQLSAIEELTSGHILRGGVGTGKSRTALAYYYLIECRGGVRVNGVGDFSRMETPKDLYIITTGKKRDSFEWQSEASDFALSPAVENNPNGVKVVIDSWNNIGNYTDVEDAFFIFDEQRVVGNGAWVKSFLTIAKHNRWILLSATPGDNWLDYLPVFLANGFYKNRTEFTRRHVIYNRFAKFPQVDRYVETKRLERLRDVVTVNLAFSTGTIRIDKNCPVVYDREKFHMAMKKRWHVYENRPIRQVAELFQLLRKIVNEDGSRIEVVKELTEQHRRMIIFYNFNYELELLREMCEQLKISYAEWNGSKHEDIPETDEWIYLVQYTAGAEGWNCIETNVVVFYSLNYSHKINEQARGRIDRMNTPFDTLIYYTLKSDSLIDKAITKSLAEKKTFNMYTVMPRKL